MEETQPSATPQPPSSPQPQAPQSAGIDLRTLAKFIAVIGIVVVGGAALFMATRAGFNSPSQPSFRLNLRVGIGHDLEKLLGSVLDTHLQERQIASISTAQKGVALDVIYQARFRPSGQAEELVKSLNLIEGVQDVQLDRRGLDED